MWQLEHSVQMEHIIHKMDLKNQDNVDHAQLVNSVYQVRCKALVTQDSGVIVEPNLQLMLPNLVQLTTTVKQELQPQLDVKVVKLIQQLLVHLQQLALIVQWDIIVQRLKMELK